MVKIVKHTQLGRAASGYSGGKNIQTRDGNPDLQNSELSGFMSNARK